jgi:hypothetical protein
MKPRGPARSVDSLSFRELHGFIKRWRPPIRGIDIHHRDGWKSWAEYHAAYDQVRDELLALIAAGGDSMLVRMAGGALPFAETIEPAIAAEGPNAVHDLHGHASLRHAHIYVRAVSPHVHSEWRVDPPLRLPDGTMWHGVIWPATEVRPPA